MESYFKTAPEKLLAKLPKRIELTDEDEQKIRLPTWRYTEIENAILALFRKVDARFIPLDPLAIAQAIGCGPFPYRTFGPVVYPVLKKASPDALTIWLGETPAILFDDRMTSPRCRFSVMHEIGHVCLGHRENSKLAEIEANRFAASALCPIPLLFKTGLADAIDISGHFGVSVEFSQLRLQKLAKWKTISPCRKNNRFGMEVCARFQMKRPIQTLLFDERAIS